MVNVQVSGKKVTITVDLQEPRPSSSGKSDLLYSTGGFIPLAGTEYKVNMTIIAPRRGR